MSQYGDVNYWNGRFGEEDEFDWYHRWSKLKNEIEKGILSIIIVFFNTMYMFFYIS